MAHNKRKTRANAKAKEAMPLLFPQKPKKKVSAQAAAAINALLQWIGEQCPETLFEPAQIINPDSPPISFKRQLLRRSFKRFLRRSLFVLITAGLLAFLLSYQGIALFGLVTTAGQVLDYLFILAVTSVAAFTVVLADTYRRLKKTGIQIEFIQNPDYNPEDAQRYAQHIDHLVTLVEKHANGKHGGKSLEQIQDDADELLKNVSTCAYSNSLPVMNGFYYHEHAEGYHVISHENYSKHLKKLSTALSGEINNLEQDIDRAEARIKANTYALAQDSVNPEDITNLERDIKHHTAESANKTKDLKKLTAELDAVGQAQSDLQKALPALSAHTCIRCRDEKQFSMVKEHPDEGDSHAVGGAVQEIKHPMLHSSDYQEALLFIKGYQEVRKEVKAESKIRQERQKHASEKLQKFQLAVAAQVDSADGNFFDFDPAQVYLVQTVSKLIGLISNTVTAESAVQDHAALLNTFKGFYFDLIASLKGGRKLTDDGQSFHTYYFYDRAKNFMTEIFRAGPLEPASRFTRVLHSKETISFMLADVSAEPTENFASRQQSRQEAIWQHVKSIYQHHERVPYADGDKRVTLKNSLAAERIKGLIERQKTLYEKEMPKLLERPESEERDIDIENKQACYDARIAALEKRKKLLLKKSYDEAIRSTEDLVELFTWTLAAFEHKILPTLNAQVTACYETWRVLMNTLLVNPDLPITQEALENADEEIELAYTQFKSSANGDGSSPSLSLSSLQAKLVARDNLAQQILDAFKTLIVDIPFQSRDDFRDDVWLIMSQMYFVGCKSIDPEYTSDKDFSYRLKTVQSGRRDPIEEVLAESAMLAIAHQASLQAQAHEPDANGLALSSDSSSGSSNESTLTHPANRRRRL